MWSPSQDYQLGLLTKELLEVSSIIDPFSNTFLYISPVLPPPLPPSPSLIPSFPTLSLLPPLHLPPPSPSPFSSSSSPFPLLLLLFLLSQDQYKKLFESCQQHYQGEGPTGILLIYPQHCVHLIEAPWRVLRDVIHNLHEMDSNG